METGPTGFDRLIEEVLLTIVTISLDPRKSNFGANPIGADSPSCKDRMNQQWMRSGSMNPLLQLLIESLFKQREFMLKRKFTISPLSERVERPLTPYFNVEFKDLSIHGPVKGFRSINFAKP